MPASPRAITFCLATLLVASACASSGPSPGRADVTTLPTTTLPTTAPTTAAATTTSAATTPPTNATATTTSPTTSEPASSATSPPADTSTTEVATTARRSSTTALPVLESAPPRLGCVNGWLSPLPRSPLYEEALDIIRRQLGLTGQPVVDAIRWFRGPDVPWIIEPKYENVERWYVKTTKPNDPLFTGRFLIEKRTDKVKGVSAVARHDTTGYQSPDWRGFAGEGKARVVPGLPGRWGGLEYDFVTGEGDSGNRGLPGEVEGCLAGT